MFHTYDDDDDDDDEDDNNSPFGQLGLWVLSSGAQDVFTSIAYVNTNAYAFPGMRKRVVCAPVVSALFPAASRPPTFTGAGNEDPQRCPPTYATFGKEGVPLAAPLACRREAGDH
jgi:hypothetical protein